MTLRIQSITFDTQDPAPIARFWAEVLGWRITYEEPDEFVLEPPAGSPEDGVSPDVLSCESPKGKVASNSRVSQIVIRRPNDIAGGRADRQFG